jgi:hypothetical protein
MSTGPGSYPLIGTWASVPLLPLIYLILRTNISKQNKTDRIVGRLDNHLAESVASAERHVDDQ